MKIDDIDFETKRRIMISFNVGIIDGNMNEANISNLDKIFNRISKDECDMDVYLCKLWLEIKLKIKLYYENNKEKLNKFLNLINLHLYSITNDIYFNKELVKGKRCL